MKSTPIKIAALIATKNRNQELIQRSIQSVLNQTVPPNYLIVVDDSDELHLVKNAKAIEELDFGETKLIYQKNRRTPGACGAWNQGLIFLSDLVRDDANWFVAVLDDDDSWDANYLEKCKNLAVEKDLDMVAADIIRIEVLDEAPMKTLAPDHLNAEDFLVSNPGIQGSNLFVRLEVLLAAGLFDEALRSTTDRDICIRIADLHGIRFQRLPELLVKHYAEPGRNRLTKRGSDAKLQGLTSFWLKHASRMNAEQKLAFKRRAENFFDWVEPQNVEIEMSKKKKAITCFPSPEEFSLCVGVISGNEVMLKSFLESLKSLMGLPYLKTLNVVVLENGTDLGGLIKSDKTSELEMIYISQAQQRKDQRFGNFGQQYRLRPEGIVDIAQARTMLQAYLADQMAALDCGNERVYSWILDDDMRIDSRAQDYLSWLPSFADEGVDVLIGNFEGASPNPPLHGLRVQLVDLWHNYLWLEGLEDDQELPDRGDENHVFRERYPDYYYDLSRKHSAHLESPMWMEADFTGERVGEAKARLKKNLLNTLNGFPLTRSIQSAGIINPIHEASDSVNRGGNTFILNPRALNETPNIAINIAGKPSRRSDMIWAIINRNYRDLTIKKVSFPVLHSGRVPETTTFEKVTQRNLEKVEPEIVGASFYAGLTSFLEENRFHNLDFSTDEIDLISQKIRREVQRRLSGLKLSFLRIAGIANTFEKHTNAPEISTFVSQLREMISMQRYKNIEAKVEALSYDNISKNLSTLRTIADDFDRTRQNRKLNTSKSFLKDFCILPTKIADFRLYDTGDEGVRLISFGDIKDLGNNPLLRMHSSCLFSEIFGARDCDCADQLNEAMKKIAIEGRGIIVHLDQEGRGQGLSNKIKAVHLMQSEGLDTVESFEHLNLEQDIREYFPVLNILKEIGIDSVRLISNNPRKIDFLEKHGIQVDRVGTNPNIRPENEDYLKTKNAKLNHQLPLEFSLDKNAEIRFNHSDQPWGEFSNFAPYSLYVNGKIWPTNEHFYQAQKFENRRYQETIRTSPSPMRAKTTARKLAGYIRDDWDSKKNNAMLTGLRAKFSQHPNLAVKLVETGECGIIEHSLQDAYWGDPGDSSGRNELGKLLMQVRQELSIDQGE